MVPKHHNRHHDSRRPARDLILAVLENMRRNLEPLKYSTLAPSRYLVYLHPTDTPGSKASFQFCRNKRFERYQKNSMRRTDAQPSDGMRHESSASLIHLLGTQVANGRLSSCPTPTVKSPKATSWSIPICCFLRALSSALANTRGESRPSSQVRAQLSGNEWSIKTVHRQPLAPLPESNTTMILAVTRTTL